MDEIMQLYQEMGISEKVYKYGEETIQKLRERFEKIDKIA